MSSASVTSSKRERESSELLLELESVRGVNTGLRSYLEHLRTFRKNLKDVHSNSAQMNKLNVEWIDAINMVKDKVK